MADLDRSSPVVVLHRQQLLFLIKEALFVCSETGLDLAKDYRLLGNALLRANDLLAHIFPKTTTLRQKALVAAAHFFGIQEAGAFHSYEYKILRSFWMLQKTLPLLAKSQPFFDIPNLFKMQTRLELTDFQVLQFMTMTSFIREVARTRVTSPIDLPETWFSTTDFGADAIKDYLSYICASPDELKHQVTQQREPSDFTAFRETPLLRLDGRLILLDFNFLCEKAESGPFWAARRQIPEAESNVYFSFWGNLFERYISTILQLGAAPKFNKVIPDPRFPDGDQFTDCAVLSGDALLMVETKTSTISAKAKYGGDLGYLERTLRRNFVEDGKSPKALRQIVSGLRKLFKDGLKLPDIQANKINRIFPVLVTRDEVGSTVGINVFLNEIFQELMHAEGMKISQSVAPLTCLSVEDLERVSPRGKDIGLDKVFEGYCRACRRDSAKLKPFMLTPNDVLKQLANKETADVLKDTAVEIGDLTEGHMKAGVESRVPHLSLR